MKILILVLFAFNAWSDMDIVKTKTSLGVFPRSDDTESRMAKFIKGTNWVDPLITMGFSEKPLVAPNGKFSISFEKERGDTGDFERYRVFYNEKGKAPRLLGREPMAWASISPDSRFVIFEPLTVFEVKKNRFFELSADLKIPNYIQLLKWSKDGKSLILSRFDCGMDCSPQEKMEYLKLQFK